MQLIRQFVRQSDAAEQTFECTKTDVEGNGQSVAPISLGKNIIEHPLPAHTPALQATAPLLELQQHLVHIIPLSCIALVVGLEGTGQDREHEARKEDHHHEGIEYAEPVDLQNV